MQRKKANDWRLKKAILKSSSSKKKLPQSTLHRKFKLYKAEETIFVSHRLFCSVPERNIVHLIEQLEYLR